MDCLDLIFSVNFALKKNISATLAIPQMWSNPQIFEGLQFRCKKWRKTDPHKPATVSVSAASTLVPPCVQFCRPNRMKYGGDCNPVNAKISQISPDPHRGRRNLAKFYHRALDLIKLLSIFSQSLPTGSIPSSFCQILSMVGRCQ
jgi:hypothetical protein